MTENDDYLLQHGICSIHICSGISGLCGYLLTQKDLKLKMHWLVKILIKFITRLKTFRIDKGTGMYQREIGMNGPKANFRSDIFIFTRYVKA